MNVSNADPTGLLSIKLSLDSLLRKSSSSVVQTLTHRSTASLRQSFSRSHVTSAPCSMEASVWTNAGMGFDRGKAGCFFLFFAEDLPKLGRFPWGSLGNSCLRSVNCFVFFFGGGDEPYVSESTFLGGLPRQKMNTHQTGRVSVQGYSEPDSSEQEALLLKEETSASSQKTRTKAPLSRALSWRLVGKVLCFCWMQRSHRAESNSLLLGKRACL